MTDRPPPPGQPLQAFLDDLSYDRRLALSSHLGAGLFNARHAAECVTHPGARHRGTVPQLLTYLSTAIRELEAARAVVTEQMEGGQVTD
jgi:hypothetical protein